MADIKEKFIDIIEKQAYKNHVNAREYFRDWVTVTALTTSGVVMGMIGEVEEERKRLKNSDELLQKYTEEDISVFLGLTDTLIKEMAENPRDILGVIHQRLNSSNASLGQFFTPLNICTMMSEITIGDELTLPYNSSDPTCGSGVMAIGEYIVLKKRGYTTRDFNFVGQDIDHFCCMMTYVQLESLGISAVICHDNSLTNPYNEDTDIHNLFYTSQYIVNSLEEQSRGVKEAV